MDCEYELYHYGVLGMKWGVRRYQNKDGSLTRAGKKRLAMDLKDDYNRNYNYHNPDRTSDNFKKTLKDAIDRVITVDDLDRVSRAKKRYLDNAVSSYRAEETLDKLGKKYSREICNEEIRKHPNRYKTASSRAELRDYYADDAGYEKARKSRPDLDKIVRESSSLWKDYINESRRVSDKLLGRYGDMPLNSDSSWTIRNSVGEIVQSMEKERIFG